MTTTTRAVIRTAYGAGMAIGVVIASLVALANDLVPMLGPELRLIATFFVGLALGYLGWRVVRSSYRSSRLDEAEALENDCPRDEDGAYRAGWIACAQATRSQYH